jgi:PAS domain-containing protein
MPGMLRAQFSERNKLLGLELVYDAMGFMQQLERASGREGAAQVIPSTLEMALSPSASDARVISTAKPPFQIVNVNDVWTQITGYTQMEVESEPYLSLMEGEGTVPQANERHNKPTYDLEEVAKGRTACTTNIHYDKAGNDFMEYVCSYPLTKYVFLERFSLPVLC